MKFTKDLFKAEKAHQTLLAIVFAIYIIFNIDTPDFLQPLVNNVIGHVVIILLALSVFVHTGPIAGVLGFVMACVTTVLDFGVVFFVAVLDLVGVVGVVFVVVLGFVTICFFFHTSHKLFSIPPRLYFCLSSF